MMLNASLRKQISAAVRVNVRGASPLIEVGNRFYTNDVTLESRLSNNALHWSDDSDLFDVTKLRDVNDFDDDAQHAGCYELDLYVTTGLGPHRELECNVYVLIRDGAVVGATANEDRLQTLKRQLNFPKGRGW